MEKPPPAPCRETRMRPATGPSRVSASGRRRPARPGWRLPSGSACASPVSPAPAAALLPGLLHGRVTVGFVPRGSRRGSGQANAPRASGHEPRRPLGGKTLTRRDVQSHFPAERPEERQTGEHCRPTGSERPNHRDA
ncbi:hypothetical protein ADZ36_03070 [Streptomyces fradiae]|uniref:Uncharacterized protein n=1 Tax=Streptomyces fradiae TaxID=1906 RepID=A0ACC4WH39_STRFR|nr:hypothetical protein ADZ36_03070 [Streptomyces fradiae]